MKTMFKVVVMIGMLLLNTVVLADESFKTNLAGEIITEYPGVTCPIDNARGCYVPETKSIYYAKNAPWERLHEIHHVFGMRHSPWKDVFMPQFGNQPGQGMSFVKIRCAVVTEIGHTEWDIGDVMCVEPDGQYKKANPRVRAEM